MSSRRQPVIDLRTRSFPSFGLAVITSTRGVPGEPIELQNVYTGHGEEAAGHEEAELERLVIYGEISIMPYRDGM